ncbi:MAG: energy-coupled thiamine transporter ThiT [Clostridia bacterium]|nr:energy-coupled thiamine transporter ThiT [Clostridia bacterium]
MNRALRNNLIRLTTSAIMIALATALSLVKVFKLPLGGSITPLSMLPICLLSVMYGLRWGLGSAFVYASVQFLLDLSEAMSWGMTPTVWAGMIIFDYFIAFTVLGLAGIFRKHRELGALAGTCLALVLRFVSHVISGTFFFDIWMPEGWNSAFFYSVCYNGSFMLPELAATALVLFFILKIPAIKKIVFEQNGLPFTK